MASDFERRFGLKLIELYGVTECCVAAWDPLTGTHRPGACGQVCEHHEVKIFDDHDCELSPGEIGEIVVRPKESAGHMTKYYGDPEATVASWRNLWYHSGDLGFLDDEGWLHFASRKKEAIRRRGTNISAYEIEQVVSSHPAILEAVAIGVPSELTDEEIKVVAVRRPGADCSPIELVEFAAAQLPRFMVPRYVEFVDAFPVGTTHKVNRRMLQEFWNTTSTFDGDAGIFLGAQE
jgi:crotonobetaine/carnitine-CoA ligase